jgi:hypothetical protein
LLRFQQILGIRFFDGDVEGAVDQISRNGGLVAAPGAPSLVNLRYDADYHSAVSAAGDRPEPGWCRTNANAQ